METISLGRLSVAFLPAAFVIFMLGKWSLGVVEPTIAMARMLMQLLLVGFVLAYIFESNSPAIVFGVGLVMVFVAGWIALRSLEARTLDNYLRAVVAISLGGGVSLALMTQGVLHIQPWFSPKFVVPLAGMTFANAMNAVSLAAERFEAELKNGAEYPAARNTALRAALIPVTNSLLAVGLVSIPGMMTGQVLSGVEPFIAARYQIMIMCMVFGSAGMSTIAYLWQLRPSSGESVYTP